jgi:competence protein ComEC
VSETAARPPDLRLVVPALAAWIGAALGVGLPAKAAITAGCALAVAAAAGAVVGRSRGPAWRVVAIAVVCAGAGLGCAGARTAARSSGPLPRLAQQRARVSAEVVLTSDPVRLSGRVVGARRLDGTVFARARVARLTSGGRTWRLRQPVVVFGSGAQWLGRLPGDRVAVFGTLSPADQGAVSITVRGPPVLVHGTSLPGRVAGRLRAGLHRAVARLPAKTAGLLPGLVDGDTSRLDPELSDAFKRVGMTHLVAVSGSNVAFTLAAALLLARRMRIGPRTAAVLAGIALAGFVVLVRPTPSVLRAAGMGGIALMATVTGRELNAIRTLAAVVLGLVLFDPSLSRSPGFALSTCATAGLLVLGPPLRGWLARHLPAWLADVVAVPLAAQLACLPLVAALAGQISLAAVPANIVAMPAVGLATVGGVVAAFVAPVWMPGAQAAAWVAGVPTGWLVRVAEYSAAMPASTLAWLDGWAGVLAVLAAVAAGAFVLRRRSLRRVVAAVSCAALAAFAGVHTVAPGWPPKQWSVVVCDVGQGDAIVVRAGRDVVLVDTGPDPAAVDGCLHDLDIRRIAAVILTHMHADHVEGIPGVLRGRSVGVVQVGPLDEPADEVSRARGWLAARHVPIERAVLGETRTVGDIAYTVLGPSVAFHGTESDPNNSSLVLHVAVPGLALLLTGDVEEPAQLALLGRREPLRADVLKVPHHGSRKMLAEFAALTGARVAVTSVGRDNPYGHPAPVTMERLADDGMRGYRTDRDGDVAIAAGASPGAAIEVSARSGRGRPPTRPPPQEWTRVVAYDGIRRLWCPVRPAAVPTVGTATARSRASPDVGAA